jgi:serine/threonine protein kinase
MSSTERAQRALLCGALAYRLGLLGREALASGLKAWTSARTGAWDDAFRRAGSLDAASTGQVEGSALQLLALHGGDLARALAAVDVDAPVRDALAAIGDAELSDALAGLGRDWPVAPGTPTNREDLADAGADDPDRTLGYDTLAPDASVSAVPVALLAEPANRPATVSTPAPHSGAAAEPDVDPDRTISDTGTIPDDLEPDAPPLRRDTLESTVADGTDANPQATGSIPALPCDPTTAGAWPPPEATEHFDDPEATEHFDDPEATGDGQEPDPYATVSDGPGRTFPFIPTSGSALGKHATAQMTDPGGPDPHVTAQMTGGATTQVIGGDLGGSQGSVLAEEVSESSTAPSAGPWKPGRSRYRIVRPHARGGLGEVFLAVDSELNREVAVKEIQGRHADDALSRARFVVEAEVTGGLEHPGIVPVYGLGTYVDGRPYYAMRFIRGESLREAIGHYHSEAPAAAPAPVPVPAAGGTEAAPEGPAPSGSRELELHKLLRRFIDVCNAIEYAHSRGVLHRDLKPANIMLGPFGETLVVDWGLAKPLDPTEGHGNGSALGAVRPRRESKFEPVGPGTGPLRPLSASGSMYQVLFGSAVGTPHFMSPEQANGAELGPVSDVYSLGAILYNLLVGRPPFTERQLLPLLEKVRKGDFDRPRQVKPEVHRALEAVCLKALALNPEDRYQSARELAEDVEHWMADDPVGAYAEPWTVRAARWARRHRTLVTTAVSLLVMAVVGLSASTFLINRERARTEANFLMARSAVDTLLTQLGAVELVDIPGAESVRQEMLERARQFYDRFLALQGPRPSVRQGAGQAYVRAGKVMELLGRYPEAEKRYRKAIDLLRPMSAGRGPEADVYRRDLAEAHHELGVLLTRMARYKPAEDELTAAVETRGRLAARNDPRADDRAAEDDSVYRLGALLARRPGNKDKAQAYYSRAIAGAEARVKQAEKDAKVRTPEAVKNLARYRNQNAILLRWSQPQKAEELLNLARADQQLLVKARPTVAANQWLLSRTLNNLGALDDDRDRVTEADKSYQAADALLARLSSDFAAVPDYRFELALLRLNYSWMYFRSIDPFTGQIEPTRRTIQFFENALKLAEKDLDSLAAQYPGRPDYQLRATDARVRLATLGHQKAILDNREANAIPDAGDTSRREALRKQARDGDREVEVAFREAIDDLDALIAPKQFPEYADSIDYRLAAALARVGLGALLARNDARQAEAETAIKEALRLCDDAHRDDPASHQVAGLVFDANALLAELRSRQNRYEDGVTALFKAAHALADDPVPSPITLGKAARTVAEYLTRSGDPKLTAKHGPALVKLLRQAIDLGFPAANELDQKAYDALKDLKEFQDLRKAVKTPAPARG